VIKMKKDDDYRRKIILESLYKNGVVSFACKNAGISRETFYRWQREDFRFKEDCDDAEQMGREENCDMVEAGLMKEASKGNVSAMKFFLQNNSPKYMIKKPVDPIRSNKMTLLDLAKQIADEKEINSTESYG